MRTIKESECRLSQTSYCSALSCILIDWTLPIKKKIPSDLIVFILIYWISPIRLPETTWKT